MLDQKNNPDQKKKLYDIICLNRKEGERKK